MALTSVARTPTAVSPGAVRRQVRGLPAWPLDLMLWGFPVFWVLGLAPFATAAIAVVMIVLMIQRRGAELVPGVLPLLALIAWSLGSAIMLDSGSRVIGYLLREANLVAVAVALLYLVSARRAVSATRVLCGLSVVWATVVVGGCLGVMFPDVRLHTPVGALLPGSLMSNEYVRDLVNPPLAEVQQPWGAPEPFNRPSAPFPYANSWGTAMSLLTPVALATYSTLRSRRLRLLIVAGLAASVIPAAASLNRGMLIGLAVAVVYVAVRLLLKGHVLPFLAVAGAGVLGTVSFAASGLLDSIITRQQYSDTTSGRASLYAETFRRTLESPLLGWGAPRPSEVHGISVGTQGHVWFLMFSYGFVGLALFLVFLWGNVLRTWNTTATPALLWIHSVVIVASVIVFFYGLDTMQLLTVVLCAGILLLTRYGGYEPGAGGGP